MFRSEEEEEEEEEGGGWGSGSYVTGASWSDTEKFTHTQENINYGKAFGEQNDI